MIRADNGYASIGDGIAQGIAVGQFFYRGVALYQRAFREIVVACEVEVGYASLAGDVAAQQREFFLSTDVRYMQLRAKRPGHLCGQSRRFITRFLTTDNRVKHYGRVVAVCLFHLFHIVVDDVGVLAMRHNGYVQSCRSLEDV